MKSISEEVKAIIAEKLGIELPEVVDKAHLQIDLGADSLDMVEIVMEFEKKFDIEITDEEVGNHTNTVGDIIDYIEMKISRK